MSRSIESVVEEAKILTTLPGFKGYIHDVGGPTANFRYGPCKAVREGKKGVCKERRCLAPQPCKNLICDQSEYVELLEKVAAVPKIKKVFVRSGVRFDYAVYDKDETFIDILAKKHVSGQLKTAPEHISNNVLRYMENRKFRFTSVSAISILPPASAPDLSSISCRILCPPIPEVRLTMRSIWRYT